MDATVGLLKRIIRGRNRRVAEAEKYARRYNARGSSSILPDHIIFHLHPTSSLREASFGNIDCALSSVILDHTGSDFNQISGRLASLSRSSVTINIVANFFDDVDDFDAFLGGNVSAKKLWSAISTIDAATTAAKAQARRQATLADHQQQQRQQATQLPDQQQQLTQSYFSKQQAQQQHSQQQFLRGQVQAGERRDSDGGGCEITACSPRLQNLSGGSTGSVPQKPVLTKIPQRPRVRRKQAVESKKFSLGATAKNLLQEIKSAEKASAWHDDLEKLPVGASKAFLESLKRRLSGYNQSSIPEKLTSWRRWKAFVRNLSGASPVWTWNPPPWVVADFFQRISAKGPTAAAGAAANLRWIQKILRINLKLDDDLVSPFIARPRAYRSKQKAPLEIKVLAHLDMLASGDNKFIAHVAGLSLFIVYGVIREAHVQRSFFVKRTKCGYIFSCREGKSAGGKPFDWFLPQCSMTGLPVAEAVIENLAAPSSSDAFLFRGFIPNFSDPVSATAWSTRKLSYAASKRARWTILGLHPLSLTKKMASRVSSYSARRVLPSVAGEAGLNAHEKAALSNWADICSGGDLGPPKAALAMSAHYDDMKLQQSAASKTMVISALSAAVRASPLGFNTEWSGLREWYPSIQDLRSSAASAGKDCGREEIGTRKMFLVTPSELVNLGSRKRLRAEPLNASTTEMSKSANTAPSKESQEIQWVHSNLPSSMVHIVAKSSAESIKTACGHNIKIKNARCGNGAVSSPSADRLWCNSCGESLLGQTKK